MANISKAMLIFTTLLALVASTMAQSPAMAPTTMPPPMAFSPPPKLMSPPPMMMSPPPMMMSPPPMMMPPMAPEMTPMMSPMAPGMTPMMTPMAPEMTPMMSPPVPAGMAPSPSIAMPPDMEAPAPSHASFLCCSMVMVAMLGAVAMLA